MRLSGILRSAAALALFGVGLTAACGTDAEGVSQCRTIEAARCRAGAACGQVSDVDACLRYTRDHCLHGTATGTPNPGDVNDCVDVLQQLGSCAQDSDGKMLARDCVTLVPGVPATTTHVCDVIEQPEQAKDCSFLMPIEVDDDEPTPPREDAGSDGG
jgi:hypothetical protein